eukprot:4842153-Alexandrium_andersonii.AAC.1
MRSRLRVLCPRPARSVLRRLGRPPTAATAARGGRRPSLGRRHGSAAVSYTHLRAHETSAHL